MNIHDATETAYKNGYAQGLEDAVKWISVKDRLPDSGKYVLAYCSDGLYGEGHYRAYENKWYLSKITYKSIPDVTHWMPLPEPPKEGDGNE